MPTNYFSVRALMRVRHDDIERIPGDVRTQDFVIDQFNKDLLVAINAVSVNGTAPAPVAAKAELKLSGRYVNGALVGLADQAGNDFMVNGSNGAPYNPEALPTAGARYYPGDVARTSQGAGLVDASGNGGTTALGSAQTAAVLWANAGYFSTTAGLNKHVATDFTWDFDTDTVVITGQIKAATPGGLTFWMGNSQAIASTPDTGLAIGSSTAGQLLVYLQNGGAGTTTQLINTGVIADGADHDFQLALDPRNRSMYAWIDGVLVYSKPNAYPAGLGKTSRVWAFGGSSPISAAVVCQFKQFNLVKGVGCLPANINDVATKFHTTPGDVTKLFNKNSRSLGLFIVGQSNETGQGVTAATNTSLGTPIKDPTYPNGQANKRSFYPAMAAVLGAADYKVDVMNYAIGGSGLRDSWVGYLANWANLALVKRGSWVVSNGGLWKCAIVGQVNLGTCTVAPAGAADTTGADNIPWTYIGPYTGQYAMGVQPKDSALYDPNGNVATLVAAMAAYVGPRKVVLLQFGQTDGNIGVSRADFSAALQVFARHMVIAGANKVLLGMSLYAEAAWKGNYDTALVPGLNDALAVLTHTYPNVVMAGLNMYTALGALAVNPGTGVGLQADSLHGNDPVYDMGGTLSGQSILASL